MTSQNYIYRKDKVIIMTVTVIPKDKEHESYVLDGVTQIIHNSDKSIMIIHMDKNKDGEYGNDKFKVCMNEYSSENVTLIANIC